ncbi:SKN1/KRE6 family beta-glucan synthesis-associated protein [Sporobolomyces koalae]|uniref:SKN1/KRE6 family beta-glucan synthesis-associated protein n=1 Tax=Sporobolomyces koalae TaxID=500713 RepID=UPI00318133C5
MSPPQTPSPPDFEDQHASPRRRPGSRLSQSISNMFYANDGSQTTLDSHSGSKRDSFHKERESLDPASYAVLTGAVGGNFGPFPRSSTFSTSRPAAFSHRDSMASSSIGIDPVPMPYSSGAGGAESPQFSDDNFPTYRSSGSRGGGGGIPTSNSRHSVSPLEGIAAGGAGAGAGTGASAALLWEKEPDDFLHDPDPALDRAMDKQMRKWSVMALVNTVALCVIIIVLVGLFAGWPIYRYVIKGGFPMSDNHMITNSSGQVPSIPGLPGLIDSDTPQSAYTRTGFDGKEMKLVFSDEFNTPGRTFWPGDDPFWEAVDLHYWATVDFEWYDPDAITTKDGNLEITMTQEPIHDLNFRSGMLQSWNKFCFTGGYIEVNLSLPGTPTAQGYWPGVWTMGNLGRPGYGASVDGMWPYSYNHCDSGTLPNQTYPNGTTPAAAKTSGDPGYGGELSWLVGQRASACTCPSDSAEHPGPNVKTGRGAPEIDILEGQIAPNGKQGSASQSMQIAPFNAGYAWKNSTPDTYVWDESITSQNKWHGSVNQESMSLNTLTDSISYEGAHYTNYGFEYTPGPDGQVTWAIDQSPTWRLLSSAVGPDAEVDIGQRDISQEPMAIIMNLAISTKFQQPQWDKVQFPGTLRVDYVRVYQEKDNYNVGCDPKKYPTKDYIENHMDLYTNNNLTTFKDSKYTKPKNRLTDQC